VTVRHRAPLRVLHCLDSFDSGGTELNAVRTMERLDRTVVEPLCVCLSRRGPLAERVERAGVTITEFAIPSLLSVGAVTTGMRLARWLKEQRIDIVHAHDIYSNIFVVPWARRARVPVVIASRRWWTETNRPAHVWLNRLAYRLADAVLANSDAVGRLVVEEGTAPDRVVVVPNFVDDAAFELPPSDFVTSTRRELGIEDGDVVVGCVANLHPIKDHATLLRAVARLTVRHPRIRLVLVGDGSERETLSALGGTLGLAGRLIFAGRRPHAPSLHGLFDVSVLSSRGEGFPNSVVEAMAARRPIVATRVGGVPDAIEDGATGMLVPAGNVDEFAKALNTVLSDQLFALRLATAAQARARERFAEHSVLQGLQDVYRRLHERAVR
jgi:L-malate glycosyltransferase